MKAITTLSAVGLIASLGVATATQAAIIQPSSATATQNGSNTQVNSARSITRSVDGTGLSATPTEANINTVTHTNGGVGSDGGNNYWLSASNGMGGSNPSTNLLVTFNLDTAYNIDTIYLWQYRRDGGNVQRGVRTFDVQFSGDNGTSWSTAVSAASLGMSEFDIGATIGGPGGAGLVNVQARSISEQLNVTNIRLTRVTSWGSSGYVSIPEIRFGGAVPEPGSLALLGLSGLLVARRRR